MHCNDEQTDVTRRNVNLNEQLTPAMSTSRWRSVLFSYVVRPRRLQIDANERLARELVLNRGEESSSVLRVRSAYIVTWPTRTVSQSLTHSLTHCGLQLSATRQLSTSASVFNSMCVPLSVWLAHRMASESSSSDVFPLPRRIVADAVAAAAAGGGGTLRRTNADFYCAESRYLESWSNRRSTIPYFTACQHCNSTDR